MLLVWGPGFKITKLGKLWAMDFSKVPTGRKTSLGGVIRKIAKGFEKEKQVLLVRREPKVFLTASMEWADGKVAKYWAMSRPRWMAWDAHGGWWEAQLGDRHGVASAGPRRPGGVGVTGVLVGAALLPKAEEKMIKLYCLHLLFAFKLF